MNPEVYAFLAGAVVGMVATVLAILAWMYRDANRSPTLPPDQLEDMIQVVDPVDVPFQQYLENQRKGGG